MKTSYIHVQTPNGRSLGFSARITLLEEKEQLPELPKQCLVAITRCNANDMHFNKKEARFQLATKPAFREVCRNIPNVLAKEKRRCTGRKESSQPFNYVLKRFL